MKGTIVRINEKGFGFIKPDEGGKDVFFHARELAQGLTFNDLREGDVVTYELTSTDRGPAATNVARA